MNIDIKKIGINGEGIGYLKKVPVFIDGALANETVDASIIKDNYSYKIARLNKVITESSNRVKPLCLNYGKCNGCNLMHTYYENQLEIKKQLLNEALFKYANLNIDVEIEGANNQFNYRNSIKLPFINNRGKLSIGIYEKESNHINAIEKCLVHDDLLEQIKDDVLDILNKYHCFAYDRITKKGYRYLILRQIGNRSHMCLVTGEEKIDKHIIDELCNIKQIVSIYQCINTSNSSLNLFSNKMIHLALGKHLTFKIDNLKFNLSIKSFFQLNTYQAKKLYRFVIDKLDEYQDLIVEAYSGIGVMSLLAKDKAKQIVGIEYINDAVVNGNINAKLNHIENVKFICGDAAEVLYSRFKKTKVDTLIVDPPRSGLDDKMLDAIMSMNINKIIYVSCNPATLSKNLSILLRKYEITDIRAFDMFPNTSHVECVVSMQRK